MRSYTCPYTGKVYPIKDCPIKDYENQGTTFTQSEIDKFIPNETVEKQIEILKIKYDLNFEFYPTSVLICGVFEAPEPAYFGVIYKNGEEYKIDRMMYEMGFEII